LATCDPKFPLSEWDLLMPQADITLNLLRSSRRQPKLSAYACINGVFDFNRSPLAPPGTRVVVHVTPDQRHNMAPHGVDGWYVGPSTEHYRCHKCYIPSTFGVRDALTVDWFPHTVPFPKVTTDEYLHQTASDMLTLLQGTATRPIPSLTYGSDLTNAYIQIAQILKRATASPAPAAPLPPVPAQRVPPVTPPAPEQRVPLVTPPAAPPKVLAPASSSPAPIQASVPPHNQPTSKPRKLAPHGPPRPPSRRSPRFPHRRSSRLTGRYASGPLAQAATSERYAHHIAALITTPPTAGKQGSIKKLLHGPEAPIWERGLANEWGRLLEHGLGRNRPPSEKITGTGTLFFIHKAQVPQDRKVTYANFVCNIRPQKTETHRVRMTAGGDKLDYPGDASAICDFPREKGKPES
jgi:hypothetical protein